MDDCPNKRSSPNPDTLDAFQEPQRLAGPFITRFRGSATAEAFENVTKRILAPSESVDP